MQIKVDLKTLVTVVSLFIIFAGGVGSYYVMKEEVSTLRTTTKEQGQAIDELRLKSVSDGTVLKDVSQDLEEIKGDIKALLRK